MRANARLLPAPELLSQGGRLFVSSPWDGAEDLQTYFRRGGLPGVLHLDVLTRQARLELPAGTDGCLAAELLRDWKR